VPSKSIKQHNFMEMIAHSPKMAKKAGVPQAVGKDFAAADKGKKFNKGDKMAAKKFNPKKLFKGKDTKGEKMEPVKKMKAGGFVKAADGVATKGKTKGRFV